MSGAEEVKFSMKVLIHKENSKVMFAEVGGDLADVLISFLTLPLGTIVRLLVKHYGDDAPVIGSLTTLYKGLTDLDVNSFWTKTGKLMLLNPKNPFENHVRKLKLNIDDTEPIKYFACDYLKCTRSNDPVTISMHCDTDTCTCGRLINKEIELISRDSKQVGVFTKATSFIMGDGLLLIPSDLRSGSSILQIMKDVGINGTDMFEERTVLVGIEEIMALLKGSLLSRTPLTDLIFHRPQIVTNTENSRPFVVIGQSATTSNAKNMNVKIIVQKSTGKVLWAQTREDFVDFVFSLLAIPLGGALSLFGNDFFVGSVHNLYNSFTSLSAYWHVETQFNTTQLPPKYLSKHQVFPLTEQPLYCFTSWDGNVITRHLSSDNKTYSLVNEKNHSVDLLDPKGQGSYIKGPAMFTVSDDLVVTQTSEISSISILNRLKVSLSDIEEYDVDIGIEEALSIPNASLYSTSALNNGLQPFLKRHLKKPKPEN